MFKVGDICIYNDNQHYFVNNKRCKILNPKGWGNLVLCEFFENVGGHDGDGKGKDGHCFWLSRRRLTKCYIHKRI